MKTILIIILFLFFISIPVNSNDNNKQFSLFKLDNKKVLLVVDAQTKKILAKATAKNLKEVFLLAAIYSEMLKSEKASNVEVFTSDKLIKKDHIILIIIWKTRTGRHIRQLSIKVPLNILTKLKIVYR